MLFSLMGSFLKLASQTGIPSTQLVFTRAVFQGVIVFAIMCTNRYDENDSALPRNEISTKPPFLIQAPFGTSAKIVRIVVIRGIFGAFGFVFYYYTMIALPLGDAVTLFSLYPIFTLFLALLILGEKIDFPKVIASIASVTGATMIAGPTFLSKEKMATMDINPIGYCTAILGSLFGATVVVLIRKAGKVGAHTFNLLFSWCVFGISASFAAGKTESISRGLMKEGPWVWDFTDPSWKYVFFMCFFGTAAHFCFNFGGKLAPAGLGSIARSSDIVWAYLLEILLFKQQPSWSTWLGVFFVICSLSVIALVQTNKKLQNQNENKRKQIIDLDEEKKEDEFSSLISQSASKKGKYDAL